MYESANIRRNLTLGKIVLIISYITLAFYPLAIFIGAKMHSVGIDGGSMYIISGFLAFMILTSGVLFLVSLILNIGESKKINHMSGGLKLTLISIAPVLLCYTGIFLKALTEGH